MSLSSLARRLWVRLLRRNEYSKVGDNEFVLRLIHRDHYDPKVATPFTRVGCKPNKKDIDGLSVYRADFTSPKIIDKAARKPGNYYVARIRVSEINAIKTDVGFLTVAPQAIKDPREPRGHSVIPELNTKNAELAWSKVAQRKLVALAVRGIVRLPRDLRRAARMIRWLRTAATVLRRKS